MRKCNKCGKIKANDEFSPSQWEKAWKKVLKKLEESGFWASGQEDIKNGLAIGYKKINEAYHVERDCNKEWKERDEKIKEIHPQLINPFIRWNMSVSPKVKTFYFSRHKSENEEKKTIIKKAIQEEKPITIRSKASYMEKHGEAWRNIEQELLERECFLE